MWDTITHSCPNLTLRQGWVIESHCVTYMHLRIHIINPMLTEGCVNKSCFGVLLSNHPLLFYTLYLHMTVGLQETSLEIHILDNYNFKLNYLCQVFLIAIACVPYPTLLRICYNHAHICLPAVHTSHGIKAGWPSHPYLENKGTFTRDATSSATGARHAVARLAARQ